MMSVWTSTPTHDVLKNFYTTSENSFGIPPSGQTCIFGCVGTPSTATTDGSYGMANYGAPGLIGPPGDPGSHGQPGEPSPRGEQGPPSPDSDTHFILAPLSSHSGCYFAKSVIGNVCHQSLFQLLMSPVICESFAAILQETTRNWIIHLALKMALKMSYKTVTLEHGESFSVNSKSSLMLEKGDLLIADFLIPTSLDLGATKCLFEDGIFGHGILKHPFYVPNHLCPMSPLGPHAIFGGDDDDPYQDIHERGALTDF